MDKRFEDLVQSLISLHCCQQNPTSLVCTAAHSDNNFKYKNQTVNNLTQHNQHFRYFQPQTSIFFFLLAWISVLFADPLYRSYEYCNTIKNSQLYIDHGSKGRGKGLCACMPKLPTCKHQRRTYIIGWLNKSVIFSTIIRAPLCTTSLQKYYK